MLALCFVLALQQVGRCRRRRERHCQVQRDAQGQAVERRAGPGPLDRSRSPPRPRRDRLPRDCVDQRLPAEGSLEGDQQGHDGARASLPLALCSACSGLSLIPARTPARSSSSRRARRSRTRASSTSRARNLVPTTCQSFTSSSSRTKSSGCARLASDLPFLLSTDCPSSPTHRSSTQSPRSRRRSSKARPWRWRCVPPSSLSLPLRRLADQSSLSRRPSSGSRQPAEAEPPSGATAWYELLAFLSHRVLVVDSLSSSNYRTRNSLFPFTSPSRSPCWTDILTAERESEYALARILPPFSPSHRSAMLRFA